MKNNLQKNTDLKTWFVIGLIIVVSLFFRSYLAENSSSGSIVQGSPEKAVLDFYTAVQVDDGVTLKQLLTPAMYAAYLADDSDLSLSNIRASTSPPKIKKAEKIGKDDYIVNYSLTEQGFIDNGVPYSTTSYFSARVKLIDGEWVIVSIPACEGGTC